MSKTTSEIIEIPERELKDKIYGGWVGQILGNIHGLPYEFKYCDEPGSQLDDFTLALPEGARTDDDTDVEWMHFYYMSQMSKLKIPYQNIREIWLANMNDGIWAANLSARGLMQIGLVPPATGSPIFNDAAWFNLSGQFCTEAYGIMTPGMPQTASEISRHYAHITVWGEPIQAAQYWPAIISLAFFHSGTMEELLLEGLMAVDPKSEQARITLETIELFNNYPEDWKTARQIFHKEIKGKEWNLNSTPANAGIIILSLLYGKGDLYKSIQYGNALGYDTDCNLATVGTILGVMSGFKKILSLPGFSLGDSYKNFTRSKLPHEVKISDQVEQLFQLAEKNIIGNGGDAHSDGRGKIYRIKTQSPSNLEKLPGKKFLKTGNPKLALKTLDDSLKHLLSDDPLRQLQGASTFILLKDRFPQKQWARMFEKNKDKIHSLFMSNKDATDYNIKLASLGGLSVIGHGGILSSLLEFMKSLGQSLTEPITSDFLNIFKALNKETCEEVKKMIKNGVITNLHPKPLENFMKPQNGAT